MIQLLSAIAITLFVIVFTRLLSKQVTARLVAATSLCSIAFIYVGFSLKGNPVSSILLEILVAIVFYLIAVIGYSKNNLLIAYGISLHGIWDILHHKAAFVTTDVPAYYPLFCFIVDVLLGVYFFLVFRRPKKTKVVINKPGMSVFDI
ncbi:DUF6010 family protein [Segetibacter koreensis]|uniref:DUF6010 family protein n=1 Tax=Segetibacter koreensis TaxID=398037 RepID=UPI00037AFAE0|nr:DUF6010 family protein [Segetibacter koreensis]